MATSVRRVIGSPSATLASSAASTGASASIKSTRATPVWLSAAMKLADAIAMHSAMPTPGSPTDLNACATRPRSTTAT